MNIQACPSRSVQAREAGREPLLFLGDGAMQDVHDLLGGILLAGEKGVVCDGANRFDAYRLSALAHAAGRNPREILPLARVSRATSWQQWLVLLEGKAGLEAVRFGARAVFALGPLDLLADNDLKAPVPAARRVADALARLSRSGFRVVCAQKGRRLREAKRDFLLEILGQSCRIVPCEQSSVISCQLSVSEGKGRPRFY